ncbi:MAG TPA: 2-oxoglutarate dehydrogenase complex dihydrolipoyllysine-residue succinyltransferase [Chitinophagaceae bacterium]|nr:2-oxoglutarate dehydrogenase complex dihydrolipoyllysine-residue succinyltransferase [Chitinophagaceae bacterium]
MIEIKVPQVGESINEVTLVEWLKQDGDWVERDELLCEFESEKATFELNAEEAGILHIVAEEGEDLEVGAVACKIDTSAERPADLPKAEEKTTEVKEETKTAESNKEESNSSTATKTKEDFKAAGIKATPLAQAMMADVKMDASQIKGSGSQGKIGKMDVYQALQNPGAATSQALFSREKSTQRMSNLRKTISRRLVEAKNSTAMLTTFNEADMTEIMAIRKKYKDKFREEFDVNLGFMSFFAKACAIALQEWPAVNSYIAEDEIIEHSYVDISIAVSAPKGLVVPVIRNVESLDMAEIEKAVVDVATKARNNKLTLEEMTGGTFTITNGGVFGSLMSTPIINLPQSAILGMHKIQERPMAINGKVEIRPMMYLALSYDHRIIDGRESVGFLVRVKELLENPSLLLMGKDPIESLLKL